MLRSQLQSRLRSCRMVVPVIALFLSVPSCQQQQLSAPPAPKATVENMRAAFTKAVRHSRMYALFVKQAEKERRKEVAGLYRAMARSEEIRAANHAEMLRTYGLKPEEPPREKIMVGSLEQTLKMAMSSEDLQGYAMYPAMLRIAASEKDTAAERQFSIAKEVDTRHHQLCFQALNHQDEIRNARYFVCPRCGYILTTDRAPECPLCRTKKSEMEKI